MHLCTTPPCRTRLLLYLIHLCHPPIHPTSPPSPTINATQYIHPPPISLPSYQLLPLLLSLPHLPNRYLIIFIILSVKHLPCNIFHTHNFTQDPIFSSPIHHIYIQESLYIIYIMTTVDDAPVKVPRKFPPPCWTQEEALALIEAYRERWYALRRGYLRTADWDSVADSVGQRCPGASPAKTSAQCRHKMEKLRQRYRSEKQRSLSYPGRFFSSWFYFESMDAMENGSNPGSGSNQVTVVDHNSVPLGFNLKNSKKVDNFTSSNVDHEGVLSRGGFNVKSVGECNSVPLGFRLKNSGKIDVKPGAGYRVPSGYPLYLDGGSDEETENNGSQFEGGPPGFRAKKFGTVGIRIKNLSGEQLRARKVGKLDPDYEYEDGDYDGGDGENWGKVPNDRNSAQAGMRQKFNIKNERNSNPNFDPKFMNGFPSQARSNLDRKSDSSGGAKRGRNPIEDMVSSIKLLGEGFVKMEKMKMDMAKEIETMRMDMEMKRNELLIESQQKIVDAFVKGLFEKKAKTTLSPDS